MTTAQPSAVRKLRSAIAKPERLLTLAVVIVFVLIWEVSADQGWVNVALVSRPTDIAAAIPGLLTDPVTRNGIVSSMVQMVLAFLVASASGLVAGTILALVPLMRAAYLPVVSFLLATPKPVLIPLFVLFLGIDPKAAIFYAAFQAFFYVVINVVSGIDLISEGHWRIARAFRASRWHVMKDIIVPGAIPGIRSGMWNGARHSISGVITVQLFAASSGIGVALKGFANSFRPASAFGLIVLLSVLGYLINAATSRIDARTDRWRKASSI